MAIALLTAMVLMTQVSKIYWIPSESMKPTLQENDFVLVYKLPYLLGYGEPEYGDILVFEYPVDKRLDYIKRLIGKPGDAIAIKDGILFRNGSQIIEEYLTMELEFPDHNETMVPDNSYFFLGDNRPKSIDSREWGVVSRSAIKGRAVYILWPLERAGKIQ